MKKEIQSTSQVSFTNLCGKGYLQLSVLGESGEPRLQPACFRRHCCFAGSEFGEMGWERLFLHPPEEQLQEVSHPGASGDHLHHTLAYGVNADRQQCIQKQIAVDMESF